MEVAVVPAVYLAFEVSETLKACCPRSNAKLRADTTLMEAAKIRNPPIELFDVQDGARRRTQHIKGNATSKNAPQTGIPVF